MDLLLKMVEHHIWLLGEMVERASQLDQAQLDAPIEVSVEGIDDAPTIRGLLSRLVGQMEMWTLAIAGRPYDFGIEKDEPLPALRVRMERVAPAFLAEVRSVVEGGRLDDTFVDVICDPPETFTYGGMIAHVLTFAAHRRTLVLGAYATAGITDLGAGDPAKWVAEAA